ncbi:MAG: hypothetical protein RML15_08765 [Bacteroidota bacterium]|nr:hypothetical protein [Candidatus Kapabacteria bacterium]MCX7937251.1 hypothetical protein [Chlorobiota bacterium]MDW8075736.1 hypothetical protein [Bacteroidota bacterium]MDW8272482.1 hypothetical protein [Bacteroidota bacterium]
MRCFLVVVGVAVVASAQTYIETPVSVCGFVGLARGANEVPAAYQQWGPSFGLAALVRERRSGLIAGELNFWYARTAASQPQYRYATGAIMVDVRGRLSWDIPVQVPTSVYGAAGIGALFPLNEQVLQQPPSTTFEPNTPALHFPIALGIRSQLFEQVGLELAATYVLTTTDNLNAPHDGQFDGFFVLSLGIVVPIGY